MESVPNSIELGTLNDVMEQRRGAEELVAFITKRGVTRTREVVEAGFARVLLTRLVRRGVLQRLGKGLYSVPNQALSEWHDLVEVAKAVPSAVVNLISALAFHEIGTQIPREIWIALPKGARTPKYHQTLRITRLSQPYFSIGIETHQIEGASVRVYGAAKTVADCFRMRSKVGYDVAIEALKDGYRLKKFTFEELDRYSKLNRVQRIIRPYIEAIAT